MVTSAAKAHWKPMKSADEGKMVNCRPLLSIHTLKRAKRIWFLLRQPGISQLFGFDTRVSARKIIACSSKHGTDVFWSTIGISVV
jgi:hypothetical protein